VGARRSAAVRYSIAAWAKSGPDSESRRASMMLSGGHEVRNA
jgi:hypothetical protein